MMKLTVPFKDTPFLCFSYQIDVLLEIVQSLVAPYILAMLLFIFRFYLKQFTYKNCSIAALSVSFTSLAIIVPP
jgi:hypothetical protein